MNLLDELRRFTTELEARVDELEQRRTRPVDTFAPIEYTYNSAGEVVMPGTPVQLGANAKIVFGIGFTGDGIWAVDPDGLELVQLTTGFLDEWPSYAPDTTGRVIFSREPGQNIWIMRADGSAQLQLVAAPGGGFSEEPSWRHDGNLIVFTMTSGAGVGVFEKLWTVAPDGSGLALLAGAAGHNYAGASYSPDDTLIAFQKDGGDKPKSELWLMNADTTGERQLTDGTDEDEHAAWSPDGTTIAFDRDTGAGVDVWALDVASGAERQLVSSAPGDFSEHPCFSPDGRRILFSRSVGGVFGVWTMNPDGTDLFQVTTKSHEIAKAHWGSF